MARLKDFYGVLGVAPNSEDVVIQAAYRAMLKRYHPDVNKSADAAKRTMAIHEAYRVLSNPESRARYDAAVGRAAAGNSRQSDQASSKNDGTEANAKSAPPPPVTVPESKAIWSGWWWIGGVVTIGVIRALIVTVPTAPLSAEVQENYDSAADKLDALADANSNMTATVATLADQTTNAVDYKTIEGGSRQFARTLMLSGIADARAYSEKCHRAAINAPTWEGFDHCAAFDYAAAHVDEGVTGDLSVAKSAYFQFQVENMEAFYRSGGAEAYTTITRLQQIQKSAELAVAEAIEAEVEKQRRKDETKKAKEAQAAANETEASTYPTVDANGVERGD